MVRTISIGATRHMELLKARLGRELKFFENEGLKVDLEEKQAGSFTFLACRVSYGDGCEYSEEDSQVILKHFIADVISEIILSNWVEILLKNIIREDYYYLCDEEKKLVFDYALRNVRRGGETWKNANWIDRKSLILHKLLDYFHSSNDLVIDGFIRFRLKEYVCELREAAEKAVDDLLVEREYREFIQLLRYFVEIQEPKTGVVHVVIRSGGFFNLFDERMRPLKSDYLEGTVLNLVDGEINYEDLLISALITIAPRKVVLHYLNADYRPAVLETIKSVFTGRVSECPGCSLCTSYMKI